MDAIPKILIKKIVKFLEKKRGTALQIDKAVNTVITWLPDLIGLVFKARSKYLTILSGIWVNRLQYVWFVVCVMEFGWLITLIPNYEDVSGIHASGIQASGIGSWLYCYFLNQDWKLCQRFQGQNNNAIKSIILSVVLTIDSTLTANRPSFFGMAAVPWLYFDLKGDLFSIHWCQGIY